MSGTTPTPNRLGTVVNVAILLTILILLFGPRGPLGRWFVDWRRSSQQRALVESSWPHLIQHATVLSSTPSPADTVVVFTDYQCPFCRSVETQLQQALAGGLAIAFLHLPLEQIHAKAREAASAAICADDRAMFADIHHALMETEEWMEEGRWDAFAGENGIVDPQEFVACMDSDETSDRVTANIALAARLGIQGTPTFVSDTGIEVGMDGIETVLSLVGSGTVLRSSELGDVVFVSTESEHEWVSTIGRIPGGLMLDANRIVLADGLSMNLFFVDISSGEVRTVGRRGQGPGEFQRVRTIGRTEQGGVFVDDFIAARVTVFSDDGTLVETIPYKPVSFRGHAMVPRPVGVQADGAIIFRDADPIFSERPNGPYRERISLLALKRDGSRAEIADLPGREMVRRNYGGVGFNAYEKPFSYSSLEAVAGSLVVVVDTESGYLSGYDRLGEVSITFDFGRGVVVTDEAEQLWRQERIARTEKRSNVTNVPVDAGALLSGLGDMANDEKDFYSNQEGNDVAPSHSRLIVDGDGRVWVQRYPLPGSATALWQRWHLGDHELDMVLELPADYRVLDAVGDRVLLRTTDELGVPRAIVATVKAVL
ncbi:MAG: thioredoxin domain-containing protein [Bryobacterales bacterium]|nr:thioredoxin domain-containing protein [Bryobacterales bacterium]